MDASVQDAIARWPDVPAVFGWLSLDPRGRWRLHPQGQAAHGGAGESITNTQILGFINRNAFSCGWTRRPTYCAWMMTAARCAPIPTSR